MAVYRILIVVNPIAGGKSSKFKTELVERCLDLTKFSYDVYVTKTEGDGYREVKNRIQDYDGFVAVGGDGTVNEVFKGVLNTQKWFSVIPAGSGNGLARTLNISTDVRKAINHLNKAQIRSIDYAMINNEPFINVSGIGFDALVAHKFKRSEHRGLKAYAEIALNEFNRIKPHKVKIAFDKQIVKRKVLMVSFANSSQFGNNAHIAPNASLDDGAIRIVTFKKFHWFTLPYLTWLLFNRTIDRSKLYREYAVRNAVITTKKKIHLHIDGETKGKVKKIELAVVPRGVQILA